MFGKTTIDFHVDRYWLGSAVDRKKLDIACVNHTRKIHSRRCVHADNKKPTCFVQSRLCTALNIVPAAASARSLEGKRLQLPLVLALLHLGRSLGFCAPGPSFSLAGAVLSPKGMRIPTDQRRCVLPFLGHVWVRRSAQHLHWPWPNSPRHGH